MAEEGAVVAAADVADAVKECFVILADYGNKKSLEEMGSI